MRILDLFCGAGGAAMGLHRAFPEAEIVGVDIRPQPRYPFEFVLGDAMTFKFSHTSEFVGGSRDHWPEICDSCGLAWNQHFDFVWASPPCQAYSSLRGLGKQAHRPKLYLIEPVRARLQQSGIPYVIENVVGAPLLNPVTLCGQFFGLGVRRHRLFETSFSMVQPDCRGRHEPNPIAVYGDHPERHARKPGSGGYINRAHTLEMGSDAMGIDWMNWRELTQSIPPAYSEYIGRQFLLSQSTVVAGVGAGA